jgi:gliding motility-associated-like protein
MNTHNTKNKRAWLLCILLVGVITIHAQNESNNWFMGSYLGMTFSGGTMKVIPENTTSMYAPYAAASYSDPKTGKLLLYTNGVNVYNRNHVQMLNGYAINGESYSAHAVIVPVDTNLFYIITSSVENNRGLFYAVVDLTKNNGLGDVIEKGKSIVPDADLQFCVVKQLYENGYWLIAHSSNSAIFRCYRINKDGIDRRAVISNAGSVSPPKAGYRYGKMVSTKDGSKFVFSFGWQNETAIAEEFLFDKACGKVTFKQSIYPHELQAETIFGFPAYSANDSVLYVNWTYSSGQVFLLQYNLADTFLNSYVIINQGLVYYGDIQLAPDGKIYVASSENGAVTGKVSVIETPNKLGSACNFKDRTISLSTSPSIYFVEHFPECIADASKPKAMLEKPEPVFENTCENQPVSFALRKPIQADSVRWILGDGNSETSLSFTHQYSAIGDYPVSFNWYVCGFEYTLTDTLKLRKTPSVNLGNDTTACSGTKLLLKAADTAESYLWNTGDTTAFITVTKAGKYTLKMRNGLCEAKDEMVVSYYPSIFTALGDEYYICNDDKELIKLDAGKDFTQYKWTPTGDTTQWIIVGDVGKYFVVVKDYRGCDGSDGTKVQRRCPVSVFYPNAFTPNNDGLNDVFLPVGSDVVAFHLTIYNGWGQRVFVTNDIKKGWDGLVNGKPAPEGTYIYQSSYSGFRSKQPVSFEVKGNITLLR